MAEDKILQKRLEIAKTEGCLYQLDWDANKNPDGLDDEYYSEMYTVLNNNLQHLRRELKELLK